MHEELSKVLGIELAYASPEQYSMYGSYRSYPIKIAPRNLARPGTKEAAWYTQASIPMINPLRKMIRISKRSTHFREMESLVQVARPDSVHHDLPSWLDIQTNDLMFASVILSQNVKISIHQLFQEVEAGVLAIEDNSLMIIFPGLIQTAQRHRIWELATNTLCDIKDELNP